MNDPERSPVPRPLLAQLLLLLVVATAPHAAHVETGISLFFALMVALRVLALWQPRLMPGRLLLFLLTLGGTANVLSHYGTLFDRDAGVALLTLMLGLKLLELRVRRDLYVTVFLLFFLIVTQFLYSQAFALAAVMFAVTIGLLGLLAEANRVRPQRRPLAAWRGAGLLALQALPLALLLFYLFPRLPHPLWSFDSGAGDAVTGLSDRIRLGSVSRLSQSRAIAFRVEFDAEPPPPAERYWRGPVMTRTDGREWRLELGDERAALPPVEPLSAPIGYRIMLEPTGERWLLALEQALSLPPGTTATSDRLVLAERPLKRTLTYRLVSATRTRSRPRDPATTSAALTLPETVTARMRTLVADWRASSGGDPGALITAALEYFRREPFVYTLRPPALGALPDDEFLFESRRGFCEHFATSFTLLMRIAGIPARVVTGYQGGELNPVGDYLVVRQSDAHAWSEVWLDRIGWLRVDPTAAVAPERVERAIELEALGVGAPLRFALDDIGWLRGLARESGYLLDALNVGWRRWVLDYSDRHQRRLLAALGLGGIKRRHLGVAAVVATAIALALVTLMIARGRRPGPAPVERLYRRFRRRLAEAGVADEPTVGPREFARRAIARRPGWRAEIEEITRLFVAWKYGRAAPAPARVRRLRELVRCLERR